MLLNEILLYDDAYITEINEPEDKLYYKFDYDKRSFDVNMEFQHFHEFYEIFILLDEDAGHIIEGNFYDIQLFDIVLLKKNVLHKSYYPEGSPKKRLIIDFMFESDCSSLIPCFKELVSIFNDPTPIYRFNEKDRKIVFGLINEIFTISKTNHSLKELLIHQKFIEFLCCIYTYKDKNIYKHESKLNSITDKIYAITSFIHTNYFNELSLDYIADKFFISPYYLSRQFKKVTGFTLVNYIQMTRIKNAQQLLINTDFRITAIAQQCGFTSFSQFNRVFNKFCNVSPSQFRLKELEN